MMPTTTETHSPEFLECARDFTVKPVNIGWLVVTFVLGLIGIVLLLSSTRSFTELASIQQASEVALETILYYLAMITIAIVLMIPFNVLFYIIVYKGWKSLQIIHLDPAGEQVNLLSPLTASLLFLVPVFSIFWTFFVFAGFEKPGKALTNMLNIPYRGPGRALGLSYAITLLIAAPAVFFAPACLYVGIPLGLICGIMSFLVLKKTNDLVADIDKRLHAG